MKSRRNARYVPRSAASLEGVVRSGQGVHTCERLQRRPAYHRRQSHQLTVEPGRARRNRVGTASAHVIGRRAAALELRGGNRPAEQGLHGQIWRRTTQASVTEQSVDAVTGGRKRARNSLRSRVAGYDVREPAHGSTVTAGREFATLAGHGRFCDEQPGRELRPRGR
jgi:hypothetical protein